MICGAVDGAGSGIIFEGRGGGYDVWYGCGPEDGTAGAGTEAGGGAGGWVLGAGWIAAGPCCGLKMGS
jgi:hypothetical protein